MEIALVADPIGAVSSLTASAAHAGDSGGVCVPV